MSATKRAKGLRQGDVIVCPATGRPERVTFARRGNPGRRFVRTVNHDHIFPHDRQVEVSR